MKNIDEIQSTISKCKSQNNSFAEFIAELYNGKLIEIYMGDSYEEYNLEQISTYSAAVFCGKVIGAFKECLIIHSVYIDKKEVKFGNPMFINGRKIRALNELDGNGNISDMFMDSKMANRLRGSIK